VTAEPTPPEPRRLQIRGIHHITLICTNLDRSVAFYRDVVALPFIAAFTESFGEDGTIFGLPDTRTQLEIVRARGPVADVDPFDMLVLYLPGAAAVAEATAPLRTAGVPVDPAPHPYWVARGGGVHLDPDGRRVVFAPWVYGDEPEPADPGLAPADRAGGDAATG
jgi:catechol 2,3-dioxygenase-like lactoylglutathione lyase family enzyme